MQSNFNFKEIEIECPVLDKNKILKKLSDAGIQINDYAKEIIYSEFFNPADHPQTHIITETEIRHIGLTEGGTFTEIENAMRKVKLDFCPLEIAPYIRLKYKDQKESVVKSTHESPPDSIVIFSKPLINNDEFPKGFYIRNYEGYLRLRAYKCSEDYFWKPDTVMIFLKD